MRAWQPSSLSSVSSRFRAQLRNLLAHVASEATERRYPARVIAMAMGTWFTRRRRSHSFGYMGRLPYAIPALALTAMLV